MGRSHHQPFEDELMPVARALAARRTPPDPQQLQSLKLRVRRSLETPPRLVLKPAFLGSRVALTAILVAGLLLTSAGAGLAVSGTSGKGNVYAAQYGHKKSNGGGGGNGGNGGGGGSDDTVGILGQPVATGPGPAPPPPSVGVLEETEQSRPVEAARQAGVAETGLPFTGYAAVPILLVGVLLLIAGFLLARRARRFADPAGP